MKTSTTVRLFLATTLTFGALSASAFTNQPPATYDGACGSLACVYVSVDGIQTSQQYCDFVPLGGSCAVKIAALKAHAEKPKGHRVYADSCVPLQYCNEQ